MKKLGFLTLLIMAVLLFTLTIASPTAVAARKSPAAPVAAAPAVPAATPEAHPHIDEALEAMRSAKKHLEMAEHDFKGHRAKSLEHLQMAIREAEICASMK